MQEGWLWRALAERLALALALVVALYAMAAQAQGWAGGAPALRTLVAQLIALYILAFWVRLAAESVVLRIRRG